MFSRRLESLVALGTAWSSQLLNAALTPPREILTAFKWPSWFSAKIAIFATASSAVFRLACFSKYTTWACEVLGIFIVVMMSPGLIPAVVLKASLTSSSLVTSQTPVMRSWAPHTLRSGRMSEAGLFQRMVPPMVDAFLS